MHITLKNSGKCNPVWEYWHQYSFSVMTNFMCKLSWSKGCPITSKILFLGVSVMVFLEGISV